MISSTASSTHGGTHARAGSPASGQVTTKQAAAFMIALSPAGLLVLLQFNCFTILPFSVSPRWQSLAIYPFMKRITKAIRN